MSLKVFVCHDSSDKAKLAEIKSYLKDHDIDLFLAHQDITKGDPHYIDRIKTRIKTSDVFLLIANERSKASSFCNQEVGIASSLDHYEEQKSFIIAFENIKRGFIRKIVAAFFPSPNTNLPIFWDLVGDRQAIDYKDWDDLKRKLLSELNVLKKNLSIHLSDKQSKSDLAIMSLLGSWNESAQQDKSVVERLLVDKDFSSWLSIIRESIQDEKSSPVEVKNGTLWRVKEKNRLATWRLLGDHIFNEHLDRFQECAIQVLSEIDPKFEFSPEERWFMPQFLKKIPNHSTELRKGIAETLALLGNKYEYLKHCSTQKAKSTANYIVKEVLENADWILWASLDEVLPLLAEAAPEVFLDVVERTLQKDPCPFDGLFSAEHDKGVFGATYISGLLWALEGLTWKEEHLSRATVILGNLASRDTGGKWANRPDNSLSTIFLPWFPQTMASWEKQRSAIKALIKECPRIAWKTLLSLLPNAHSSSSGCHKPWSYSVTEHDINEITKGEGYREQIQFYMEQSTEMAIKNDDNLMEIVEHINSLNPQCLDALVQHLESHEFSLENKYVLWEKISDFVLKNKKFSQQTWALPKKYIERLEKTLVKIAPDGLHATHRYLFDREDYQLYEREGDYEEQSKETDSRRQSAIKEIVSKGGIVSVIDFAQKVKLPFSVGRALGSFIEDEKDEEILKNCLQVESENMSKFAYGFIGIKHRQSGWKWVDSLNIEEWTDTQKGIFLMSLPPCEETWERASKWLQDEGVYWKEVNMFMYASRFTEKQIQICVEKLLQFKRPISALDCLYWADRNEYSLSHEQSIQALLETVSIGEKNKRIDPHNTNEIIKNLQNDPAVDAEGLCKVEWAYLRLLEYQSDYSPKTLERKLACDPEFFHENICFVFGPRDKTARQSQLTEEQQRVAFQSLGLLGAWKTPPGTQKDGTFSGDKFVIWLERVLELSKQSDRLEIAQETIGKVLMHSPEDPDGLWIHKSVAEELNKPDREHMRIGLSVAFFESRGFHWVDTTGKTERELAEKYRSMGDEVENEGFQRLCATLKGLADQCERDAEMNIERAKEMKKNDG